MVYDNVFTPAPAPTTPQVQADGTSGGTLLQLNVKEDPAPAEAAPAASSPAPTANPSIPCSSHQAGVGTAADACDYTPDLSKFKKAAYNRTYVSNSTTNATYAVQLQSDGALV